MITRAPLGALGNGSRRSLFFWSDIFMFYFVASFFIALALFLLFEVFGINDLIEDYFLSFLDKFRNRGGKK